VEGRFVLRRFVWLGLSALLLAGVTVASSGGASQSRPVGWLTQLEGQAGCLASDRIQGCGRYTNRPFAGAVIGTNSVAVSKDGRSVYFADGTLLVFRRVGATGALKQLPGNDGCVGCESLPRFAAGALAFAPDDQTLYVASSYADYGGGRDDEISRFEVFDRDVRTGALRRVQERGRCFTSPRRYSFEPTLKGCQSARGLNLPLSVAVSPEGRYVYVGSVGGISAFRRTSIGGLEQLAGSVGCLLADKDAPGCSPRPHGVSIGPLSLAMSPDGRQVYALLPSMLLAYARDVRTGSLTKIPGERGCLSRTPRDGCRVVRELSSEKLGSAMTISPDGRNVYVGNGSVIMTFTRSSSGSLDTPPTSTSLPGGYTSDIAVSPDGRSVYALSDGTLRAFVREPGTGRLSPLQCLSGETRARCLQPRVFPNARGAAITPDGRHAYVRGYRDSGSGTDVIAAFIRNTR
jgi:DNA-binding beta-propeller fold protein YncE